MLTNFEETNFFEIFIALVPYCDTLGKNQLVFR